MHDFPGGEGDSHIPILCDRDHKCLFLNGHSARKNFPDLIPSPESTTGQEQNLICGP